MSPEAADWIAIAGVVLTTVVTRASFVVFGNRVTLAPILEQALRYAPAAVIGALVVPALLLRGGSVDLSLGNQRLIAAAVASLVMWRTRSMIGTILAGMAVLTLLRLAG